MVQSGERLRVHNPRRRGRGYLRALLRYRGQRVQEPPGGREGHLRGRPGPEGSAGPKRLQGVSASSAAADSDLMPGSRRLTALAPCERVSQMLRVLLVEDHAMAARFLSLRSGSGCNHIEMCTGCIVSPNDIWLLVHFL